MIPAFDQANYANGSSISLTLAAGAKVLIAGALNDNGAASGMTWNGVAMTLIASANTGTGGIQFSVWGLLNPATGTHTLASTGGGGDSAVGGVSYLTASGWDTMTLTPSLGAGTHTATAGSMTANDLMMGIFGLNDFPSGMTVNNSNPAKGGNFISIGTNTNTGTGSVSTTFSCSNTDNITGGLRIIGTVATPENGAFLLNML